MSSSNKGGFLRDDTTGALVVSDPNTPRGEIGYAESIANPVLSQVAVANTFYALPGLSRDVVVASRPIYVVAFVPQLVHSVALADITLAVYQDGALIQAETLTVAAANKGGPALAAVRPNPSPAAGTHTYEARIKTPTAGTITAWAGPGFPAFLRIEEG